MTVKLATVLLLLCCAAGAQALSWLTYGDWGLPGKKQNEVAGVMGEVGDALSIDFVVGVGDNFYQTGVSSVDDKQWQDSFEKVYTADSLQVQFLQVLGNHDHLGNVSAQVDYAALSSRWVMDDYWYTREATAEDGQVVQFVFIDTVLLDPDALEEAVQSLQLEEQHAQAYRDRLAVLGAKRTAESQWDWIEDTLSQSTADWLIVVGHYPVYSGGNHGSNAVLDAKLLPMLNKYSVSMYLCGHEHDLQYLEADGIGYVISGTASQKASHSIKQLPQTKYATDQYGFVSHVLQGNQMNITYHDDHGNHIFTTLLTNQRY